VTVCRVCVRVYACVGRAYVHSLLSSLQGATCTADADCASGRCTAPAYDVGGYLVLSEGVCAVATVRCAV
jgi:hypothetical protein